jgi:hypothetical protein
MSTSLGRLTTTGPEGRHVRIEACEMMIRSGLNSDDISSNAASNARFVHWQVSLRGGKIQCIPAGLSPSLLVLVPDTTDTDATRKYTLGSS